jgi:pyruvate/2-oxoglutarate/acetoin dehydrogenase E1 component/TPP-dependent pyruvate/acetoin dehydrogenase alpha subunit
MTIEVREEKEKILTEEQFRQQIENDYRLALTSRHCSLLGRKEVLTGKAKFGIFGDGKEIPQIAMAKAFKPGDFRSGYYRDQTFMMAIGQLTVKEFFAQLYADTDVEREPASAGRQMNGHFATRTLDSNGEWISLTENKNSSADISPTAGQMPRLLGLAYASKLYRNIPELKEYKKFSNNGNEVAFGTIGNASTAEGPFWETINAGGVLMAPMAVSIWDDGYGISVPNEYQVTKSDLTSLLSGFAYDKDKQQGYRIYTIRGWDYPTLVKTYTDAIEDVRNNHIPAIFHITELTQPQGHSTSGSHERYKSKERLKWEADFDCIRKMREWMVSLKSTINGDPLFEAQALEELEKNIKDDVRQQQKEAFEESVSAIRSEQAELLQIFSEIGSESKHSDEINSLSNKLKSSQDIDRKSNSKALWEVLILTSDESQLTGRKKLIDWRSNEESENAIRYNSDLYSGKALLIPEVTPEYPEVPSMIDGREILVNFFETAFKADPRIFVFGEDVGKIGDVNQGLAGLQEKFGVLRITDTGIREATILGQGIGSAMRGLKPIAEIQYLDYLLYSLQVMSDDLSTVFYRTKGGQKAPVIVRTRGHRLEGIWHSGSPMGVIINALRGMYICVPRNMTKAAGFYNTLLKSDEPGLIIERLNAYRLKERLPLNLSEITTPLGIPEIIHEGKDITVVTYGACVDIAREAIDKLQALNISVELIDVQTLLPFDINGFIVKSLQKTNRIIFLDEDVPGGATAYLMQQVLEIQEGYKYLDSAPVTLTARAHRPAYGTDGDYFSKPNAEDIFLAVYKTMNESNPKEYPMVF